ncbi:metal-dependent hydrolase [Cerasicoccus fimbriatus]|uniref:metal-dependent hydrolase n=1 Tax=Cerasicoccus fimbriatus TaxID=3014554 RepID=UPI0022B5AA97|nr:metal-dependent hydrolase [Cerasicoccus sp. TK19100]
MKLQYLGHAACLLEVDGAKLLFDPFLSGNEKCNVAPADVQCDYILLTHAHQDHVGDAVEIALANDAPILANFELASYLNAKHGVKVEPVNPGGGIDLPFGRVKFTFAYHSSSTPDENGVPIYMGQPAGIIVTSGKTSFYHAGDTGLFGDMKLLGDMHDIELALLPIGDRFTMGPDDAVKAIEFLRPRYVVPIHYNTFPGMIDQDPEAFADKATSATGVAVSILECGDAVEF